jgi:hypothetical protein
VRRRAALLLLLSVLFTGCARAIAIDSGDPTRSFSIEITNETGTPMVVSYNDGRGDATLGTVAAGRTERYIIASPASTSVAIRGVATSGGRTVGPYTVALTAGSTARVSLR